MSKGRIIFSILCIMTICLNGAFAASCTTSADCDDGYYCKRGSPTNTCAQCTNPKPNNAVWDGSGEDNQPTSCPWKCNTGYYRYDDLCYQCPYGSTPTSDGKGCYWENVTFSDKNGPVTTDSSTLQLSESLLEKARAQQ